jgi:cysteine desulfurase/selenocysteine lyase
MSSFSERIRQDFPILHREILGKQLTYLDTAATAQKPQCVIDAMTRFYTQSNANVHRGLYPLAEESTVLYEHARKTVASFLGADADEIIFTKNATEGINLVARTFGEMLSSEDSIVLSVLEHHSNIVPWQQLRSRRGVSLEWIGIDDAGELRLDQLKNILEKGTTKLVALSGMSNVLGMSTPLTEITTLAHQYGAKVLVDASQLIVHEPVDVRSLNCDFLVFSGHKLYGPTGIGVLYIQREIANTLPTFLGGGEMIHSVSEQEFTLADLPYRFEAGTPAIAEAVGLNEAIVWFSSLDAHDRRTHELSVMAHALQALECIKGIHLLLGNTRKNCISFTLDGAHPHDLASILGHENICIRAGHHCAEPLHRALNISASARLSIGVYTTIEDINRCITGIEDAKRILML